jgi:hypothetical protein
MELIGALLAILVLLLILAFFVSPFVFIIRFERFMRRHEHALDGLEHRVEKHKKRLKDLESNQANSEESRQ